MEIACTIMGGVLLTMAAIFFCTDGKTEDRDGKETIRFLICVVCLLGVLLFWQRADHIELKRLIADPARREKGK